MAIQLAQDDVDWLNKKYPKLKFYKAKEIIQGELCFNREYKGVVIEDSYFLEIKLQSKRNSVLPQVKETSGKIKKISEELSKPLIDLHVNRKDETLCLCIPEKEKEYFPNGLKINIFFEQILEPYLYWVSYTQRYKTPPWEEYAHENLGYLGLYAEDDISLEKLKEYIPDEKLRV
ncbi:unnamed protein product, partial [marine sediment metagenome]